MSATARRWGRVVLAAWMMAMAWCHPVWAGAQRPARDMHDVKEGQQLQELFQDISTINLLNGLRLTRQQTEQLLALARKADAHRSTGPYAQFYRRAVSEAITAYVAFKAEAIKGEPPGREISHRAVTQEHRVQNIRNRRAKVLEQEAAGYDAELRKVVTEGQLLIVATFDPCLVPPRDLKDPVRAGQVADDRGIQVLATLRKLPAAQWEREKERIAGAFVRRAIEGPHIQITSAPQAYQEGQGVYEVAFKAMHPRNSEPASFPAALPALSMGYL